MRLQSVLDPNGPAAAAIASLTWIMISASGVISAIVIAGLARAAFRSRNAEPPSEETALRWVVLGGAAIPGLIVTALFVYAVALLGALAPSRHDPRLTIEIVGKQWWWQVRYLDAQPALIAISANEVHIPVGEPVHILLESTDVIHSFWVPELQGKTDLIPGRTNVLWLQADEPGVFRAQCAEFCGLQHAHMALFVIAHPKDEFARWLANERRPARLSAATAAGHDAFMHHGCSVCHTIRGTRARGTLGPDLTHLAGRRSLGAGTLPNTRGHLAGWIGNPQVIKPGNQMPRVPLEPQQLTALLDFLQALH
ncbi:MAG: cytochrome c oxidase subunit II [Gemmatimonadota bacterium]